MLCSLPIVHEQSLSQHLSQKGNLGVMQRAREQSLSQHLSQKANLGVMQRAREQSHKLHFMGPQKGRPNGCAESLAEKLGDSVDLYSPAEIWFTDWAVHYPGLYPAMTKLTKTFAT